MEKTKLKINAANWGNDIKLLAATSLIYAVAATAMRSPDIGVMFLGMAALAKKYLFAEPQRLYLEEAFPSAQPCELPENSKGLLKTMEEYSQRLGIPTPSLHVLYPREHKFGDVPVLNPALYAERQVISSYYKDIPLINSKVGNYPVVIINSTLAENFSQEEQNALVATQMGYFASHLDAKKKLLDIVTLATKSEFLYYGWKHAPEWYASHSQSLISLSSASDVLLSVGFAVGILKGLSIVKNELGKRADYQSDRIASDLTNDPEAAISALNKLREVFQDNPPGHARLSKRVSRLEKLQQA